MYIKLKIIFLKLQLRKMSITKYHKQRANFFTFHLHWASHQFLTYILPYILKIISLSLISFALRNIVIYIMIVI